jgi:hypothetical protein
MTNTNKRYSYLIVTVLQINVHPAGGNLINPRPDGGRRLRRAAKWWQVKAPKQRTTTRWFRFRMDWGRGVMVARWTDWGRGNHALEVEARYQILNRTFLLNFIRL